MNIITSALPDKLQDLIRAEKAKGELKSYEEFMDFVTNLTAASQYKTHDPPKPIGPSSAAAVKLLERNAATPADYTVEEWPQFLVTPEGSNFLDGKPTLTENC